MNWSELYEYLKSSNPGGFIKERLSARAQNMVNQNQYVRRIPDHLTLLSLIRLLIKNNIVYQIHQNADVAGLISLYLKEAETVTPKLIISIHNRDVANAFQTLEQQTFEEGITSDKTAAMSLHLSRYDRFKILKKDNTVIIFTNRKLHSIEYIEHMRRIVAMFPRWFETKENTTDIWMSLLEADANNFYNYLATYLNEHCTINIEQHIETFRTLGALSIEMRKHALEESIKGHKRDIDMYYRHIEERWKKLYELQEQCAGINTEEYVEAGVELIKYIDKRPGIELLNLTTAGVLELNVISELRYFDQEAARTILRHISQGITKQFIKDVFIDAKYRIQIGTAIKLNLNHRHDTIITTVRDRSVDPNTMWNPHLYHYDCWGSNRSEIQRAVEAQQLIAAIEQAYAATCSINVLDGAVWQRFIGTINAALEQDCYSRAIGNRHCKCLKNTQTGECITLAQYKKLIEEGDGQE